VGAPRGEEPAPNPAIRPDHVVEDFGELARILRDSYGIPLG
jgi:hypothetical protein